MKCSSKTLQKFQIPFDFYNNKCKLRRQTEFPSIENAQCENIVSLGVGKCSSMNFRTSTTMHFKLLWLMFGNLATKHSLPPPTSFEDLGFKRPSTQDDPGKPSYHPLTPLYPCCYSLAALLAPACTVLLAPLPGHAAAAAASVAVSLEFLRASTPCHRAGMTQACYCCI